MNNYTIVTPLILWQILRLLLNIRRYWIKAKLFIQWKNVLVCFFDNGAPLTLFLFHFIEDGLFDLLLLLQLYLLHSSILCSLPRHELLGQ